MRRGLTPEQVGVVVVQGQDGRTFWFGDIKNRPLPDPADSVRQMTLAQAKASGVTQPPETVDIIQHVASTAARRGSASRPWLAIARRPSNGPLR